MIKTVDIAWLAGLLEGDGYFGQVRKCPIIKLAMTAEDTVTRVASMWGSVVNHRRNIWETTISGARSVSIMMTLYTFLGKRRREMVASIILPWRERYSRAPNGFRAMATCHPDRPVEGYGLCSYCYHHERYIEKKKLLRKDV